MWDVACLGELVIDLIPHSKADGEWLYAPSPGGAPGNVAVGLARLGRAAAMLGKVGDEAFGRLIVTALGKHGVDISGVGMVPHEKTRLSVVTLGADGDREFIFYRDNPVDELISADDISPRLIENAAVLHLGGLLMVAPTSAAAQNRAIGLARAAGRPISLDPNFRLGLWPDRGTMLALGRSLIAQATIVKLSAEELLAVSGGSGGIEQAARSLWHDGLKLLAVTKGAAGAELFTPRDHLVCHGFAVDAIDTTAAGDAFMASLLSGLLDIGFDITAAPSLSHVLRSACAAGAVAATRRGAMGSLPDRDDIAGMLAGDCENRA